MEGDAFPEDLFGWMGTSARWHSSLLLLPGLARNSRLTLSLAHLGPCGTSLFVWTPPKTEAFSKRKIAPSLHFKADVGLSF